MMSRLSSRSLLRAAIALMLSSSPSVCCGSAGREDVDDEVERVGALDAGLRLALAAVALLRRDGQQHPAADLLADEGLVPAGDDLAGADAERGGGALAVALVEGLLAAVDLTQV